MNAMSVGIPLIIERGYKGIVYFRNHSVILLTAIRRVSCSKVLQQRAL